MPTMQTLKKKADIPFRPVSFHFTSRPQAPCMSPSAIAHSSQSTQPLPCETERKKERVGVKILFPALRWLGSEAELRGASTAEDDELGLEEDVAEDGEANARVALDAAEAGGRAGGQRGILDVRAGHDSAVGADAQGDAGQRGCARKGVATLRRVVLGARDFRVVGADDRGGQVEQSGTRVGDAVDRSRGEGTAADGVSVAREFPEAVGGVDIDVCDGTRVLARVNVAKVVGAWGTLLQVGGEEWLGEGSLGVAEERLLLIGADCVERIKSQTQQAVIVHVAGERGTDCLRQLHRLAGHRRRAYFHGVGIDVARRGTTVTVRNAPGLPLEKFGGGRLARVVD